MRADRPLVCVRQSGLWVCGKASLNPNPAFDALFGVFPGFEMAKRAAHHKAFVDWPVERSTLNIFHIALDKLGGNAACDDLASD